MLHFITTKEIPLTKQCIKELSVVKSVTLQKQFKDKNKVTKLLNSPRGIQMKALLKLTFLSFQYKRARTKNLIESYD